MTWEPSDDAAWTYVSRTLIPARLITLWIWVAVPAIIVSVVGSLTSRWVFAGLIALAVIGLWGTWLVFRQVTAHAWIEREDDLIIKRGRMWRTVTVVPYGRMQYVEVESGPIDRAFGIAKVQLHTASPGSDAQIAGVPTAEAERLRDRLASRGEAQLAGL
ncbi:PH domain-containing protein [Demequina globuliformis]|uniref:PH domain-containing protein n=1 Tax=Demequina globuliformis TaxID=676202 RepID=UPI000784D717|nr:PH domain-containing protein [Demequina globuliformis]